MEHTCLLEQLEPQYRNISAGFIANYMYPLIVDNPNYEPKSIICAVVHPPSETLQLSLQCVPPHQPDQLLDEVRVQHVYHLLQSRV